MRTLFQLKYDQELMEYYRAAKLLQESKPITVKVDPRTLMLAIDHEEAAISQADLIHYMIASTGIRPRAVQ